MQTLTVESIAEFIATKHTAEAVEFINERAAKLYRASYSRGTYGRIMAPLIKRFYPRVNLNGQSTSAGLAITGALERMGYEWKTGQGPVKFAAK